MPTNTKLKIYLVQLDIAHRRPDENRARVLRLLEDGVQPGGLIVLPEMFSTGFVAGQSRALRSDREDQDEGANVLYREDCDFLSELARTRHCHVLGSSVGEGPDNLLRNLSLVFKPDGGKHVDYQKVHPFTYGGEHRHFSGGKKLTAFDCEAFTVVPTICYDLRFPEIYRAGLSLGVQLYTVQANWPEARQSHWQALLRARAIENQAYVAGVNCVGRQVHLAFSGGTCLFSPQGEMLAEAGSEETVLTPEIDLREVIAWRNHFPAIRDLKPPEFYGGLSGRQAQEGDAS